MRELLELRTLGEAGREIVIEEFLQGEEVSVLGFCGGQTIVGMPAAQVRTSFFISSCA